MISVGIDIGRASVKVAEMEAVSRTYVLKRFLEFPLSLDPNKDRKIEVIDILMNLIPQYNPDTTRFVFCVRQEDVSLRFKKFPFRERHKILRTVPFEVEDEIPFSNLDAIFEAKIVRLEGKTADVLAMACPKDRVRDVVQLAHDGGAHPTLVSLESVSLSNLLEHWNLPPPETIPSASAEFQKEHDGEILLDIGHCSTKVLFYENGALIAVRQIDWGGRNILNMIAQKYGINVVQAFRELETKSQIVLDKTKATKEQAAFSKVIEASLNDLIRELRLKIIEVQADHHLHLVKAHMTGGTTRLKGLGGFLTQNLELTFNRLKHLSMLPSVVFEQTAKIESVSGVAIGLAIEGLKRPRNPAVDFLKGEFAKQSRTFEKIWDKWGFAIQIGAAAFVTFFTYAVLRDSMSSSLEEAAQDALKVQAAAVANLKGSAASPSKIKKFLAEHEREQKARKQAERVLKLNSALDIVNMISQNLPDRGISVDVKHLLVDGDVAEIHGYLLQNTKVTDLQRALQSASSDGKIEAIAPQNKPAPGKQPFGFKFHVSRFEGS
jgi:general secretion pathway protein L